MEPKTTWGVAPYNTYDLIAHFYIWSCFLEDTKSMWSWGGGLGHRIRMKDWKFCCHKITAKTKKSVFSIFTPILPKQLKNQRLSKTSKRSGDYRALLFMFMLSCQILKVRAPHLPCFGSWSCIWKITFLHIY